MTTRGQINSNFYQIVTVDSDGNPVQIKEQYVSNISNVANANYANYAGNALIANTANHVSVANVSGIGNIATVNLSGNGSQVLLGNGTWGTSSSGNVANANYANFAGTAYNVSGSTPAVCKLCIGFASTNMYESNDVKVGRITTLETTGCRCGVDGDGFGGSSASPGNYLSVDSSTGKKGKLKVASAGETVVAVAEGWDSATGVLTFTISSPFIMPS